MEWTKEKERDWEIEEAKITRKKERERKRRKGWSFNPVEVA